MVQILPAACGLARQALGCFSSKSAEQHRRQAPKRVGCAVITVSDTRTPETDSGGQTIVDMLETAGHTVLDRRIVPDEPDDLQAATMEFADTKDVDAILITGGTGIAERDQTPDTVDQLLTKRLPGYGELFRMLSYQEIGAAAMLSRAAGGLVGLTVVLTMPGSPAAVRLAMEKLVLPEITHLIEHARR